MNYDGGLILQKNVNRSLLKEGFTLNVAVLAIVICLLMIQCEKLPMDQVLA